MIFTGVLAATLPAWNVNVAERLPLGTVKNRLFRAREAMRDQLVSRGITGI